MSDICLQQLPVRNPVNGTFELTVRCNLHCKMCLFRHSDSENADIISKELTTQQWIDLAREVAEAGTMSLLITGGEPMLRTDFCEIWEGIYKQGFIMELYTNATLVTPKIMETLCKYPPHKIGVTIYGASPQTYKKVCGNAQAFQKAIDGIHSLLQLPSQVKFRTTIIQDNYCDLYAIQDLVKYEFGDYLVENSRIVNQSVEGACADVNECRLSPEDNVKVIYSRGIQVMKERLGQSFDLSQLKIEVQANDVQLNEKYTLFGCEAGMSQYTISWNGKLLGCQMLTCFSIDVISEGFLRAWKTYPFIVQLPQLDQQCRECHLKEECESCLATRYCETGRLGGYSDYFCKFTKVHHMFKQNKGEDIYEK